MSQRDPLEAVIRPIVEGQLRSFVRDHPEVVPAVNWYNKEGRNPVDSFVGSIAKRIINDLLCEETRVRLMQAMVADGHASLVAPAVSVCVQPVEAGVEILPAPALLRDTMI